MIHIRKGREPRSLTEYKKRPDAYFDGADKVDIREALLREQGGLCAYCMKRIDDGRDSEGRIRMKIEHWIPQAELSGTEALDYQIMLGVCNGNEGKRESEQTCDTHRKNAVLTVNPLREGTLASIGYNEADGHIYSDDPRVNDDLDKTLNLNGGAYSGLLPLLRKEVLDRFKQELAVVKRSGPWSRELLVKQLSKMEAIDGTGRKKAYSGIVIWYLKNRIKRG